MTKPKSNETKNGGASETGEVQFVCRRCNKKKPIGDMRVITRFFPMEIVCRECEKSLR